jgi:hypothetical protein
MATTTPNFGWQVPTSTDLVKDGAVAIETLGDAIDASLVDLKGGTTGQVLAKASNTDMDFVWSADAAGISPTIFAAKGDLLGASANDTPAILSVGANGETLVADSSTATGLKYSKNAPLAGMPSLGSTSLTGAATITVTGLSVSRLTVIVNNASSANASSFFNLRFNSDSGGNYGYCGLFNNNGTLTTAYSVGNTSFPIGRQGNTAADVVSAVMNVEGAFGAGMAQINVGSSSGGAGQESYNFSGFYVASAAITSVSLISSSGNFDAGTLILYGV